MPQWNTEGKLAHDRDRGADDGGDIMLSTAMMGGLVAFYVLVSAVSAYEGNWPRCTYWIGAAIITTSVLWGTR